MEIAGKAALVTGAAVGIGQSIALRLAAEGARVAVADVDAKGGDAIASRIAGAIFVRADLSREEHARSMLAAVDSKFGGLDILVNNAGRAEDPAYPDAPYEEWTRVLDLNLRAVMVGTQLAINSMRRRGGGAVVNISSIAGLGFRPHGAPAYAAAKAGVVRLTAALALLRESDNIRVNCICPDWVDTPASRGSRRLMTPEELAKLPRILSPDEIADAVVDFIRDETLAGRVLVVRGGESPRLLGPDG
jgi:NAD(P)-dependent dehydrogenase (short-subunit alcohol dehydrogenase family)